MHQSWSRTRVHENSERRDEGGLQSVEQASSRWVGPLVLSLQEMVLWPGEAACCLRHPAPPQVLFPGVPALTFGC